MLTHVRTHQMPPKQDMESKRAVTANIEYQSREGRGGGGGVEREKRVADTAVPSTFSTILYGPFLFPHMYACVGM